MKSICAGNEHIAVLTRQGDVYTVGFNGSGQLGHGNQKSIPIPKKIKHFMMTETGNAQSQSNMYQASTQSQTSSLSRTVVIPNTKINFVSSANGCESISFISEKGNLYTCGYNNYGQLGNGTQNNECEPHMILTNIKDNIKVLNVSSSSVFGNRWSYSSFRFFASQACCCYDFGLWHINLKFLVQTLRDAVNDVR